MDCSTWFLVENQPKMTYPLPPRFSAREVLLRVFVQVFLRGLVCRFADVHVDFGACVRICDVVNIRVASMLAPRFLGVQSF
jgi:hypothetical protein